MQEHLYEHFFSDGNNGFLEDFTTEEILEKQRKLLIENFENASTKWAQH